MTEIEKLLTQLININSVTGQEKEIGEFIISQLGNVPFEKQIIDIEKERFNIIVRKGNSKKWLVCHVDTVPGTAKATFDEEKIYGRGACDNKHSVAAAILLAKELDAINIIFTIGEESDFIGAKKASESGLVENAELVIVQEPTNFNIITGQCGIITFSLEISGTQVHSSLQNTDSAVHKLVNIIHDLLSKKWNCFNVGLIQGGIAENVVAGSAKTIISVRPKDEKERKSILEEIKKIQASVYIKNDIAPHSSSLGFKENIASHFSEMAFFKNCIQFGAGSIEHTHSEHEFILRSDLNVLVQKLKEILSYR